jgi:hypothetical protein
MEGDDTAGASPGDRSFFSEKLLTGESPKAVCGGAAEFTSEVGTSAGPFAALAAAGIVAGPPQAGGIKTVNPTNPT